ncbi:protein-L-isoaspartate O-methyltransferase [bacterium]
MIDILENRRHYLDLEGFDPRVLEIMRETDRADFAPPGEKNIYEDSPVRISGGQTCSQPSMVAAMATLLRLEPGMKVLEVGTGCGYSAAATAPLLEPGGTLYTIEILPELTADAEAILEKLGRGKNIRFIVGDGSVGLPDEAPFHRIYLTAGVGRKFNEDVLLGQLKPGGILLYPEAYGQMHFVKKTKRGPESQILGSVGFVHLKGDNSGFD